MHNDRSAAQHHPLRLLLVADSLHAGGAERHAVSLASALVQKGHTVTIACSVTGSLAPVAERAGVAVRPLMRHLAKRRISPSFCWHLGRLVHKGHFDLVHAHMYASALASAWATLGTTAPLIITEHSEAGWRSPLARCGSRWYYSRAERVIAVSSAIRHRLVELDGVPVDRISVIMNAISPPPEVRAEEVRRALPAACRHAPLVGVVARLQEEKGIIYFLEAVRSLVQDVPQVQFLIVGDGPLRDALQEAANQFGIEDRVHFLGFRADARAIVSILDVLVVPSLSEGTPLVTLEAMAAGVPVVASEVGGVPEQIRHEREGLLVPPGDARALSEALLSLLQHPALRNELGDAGRRRALSDFHFDTMVQATEDVYSAALGRQVQGRSPDGELDDPLAETGR